MNITRRTFCKHDKEGISVYEEVISYQDNEKIHEQTNFITSLSVDTIMGLICFMADLVRRADRDFKLN